MQFVSLLLLLFSPHLKCIKDTNLNCTQIGNQIWHKVWFSEFDKETELTQFWNIEHETAQCSRNGIEQANCNVRNNIKIIDGYAYLVAKHETYNNFEYTAATMTTLSPFTYGRFEIRARLPRGDFLRPSIFTRNDSELYWHDLGQFDMASFGQDSVLYRGIHYAHSSNKYQQVDLAFDSASAASIRLGEEFHLYGIEWSSSCVRFFWDKTYSDWFNFTIDRPITPWHHIRLQIGVGGVTFPRRMPSNFTSIKWICPALIVDHVRVYELLENDNQCDNVLINEDFGDLFSETNKINTVCKIYRPDGQSEAINKDNNEIPEKIAASFQTTQWIIAFMVILFAISIFWMMVQLRSVKRKLDTEQTSNNDDPKRFGNDFSMTQRGENDVENFEEETYEEIDNYQIEGEGQSERYVPYLPLESAYKPNEYLEIQDASNQNLSENIKYNNKKMSNENEYTQQDNCKKSTIRAMNASNVHYEILIDPTKAVISQDDQVTNL